VEVGTGNQVEEAPSVSPLRDQDHIPRDGDLIAVYGELLSDPDLPQAPSVRDAFRLIGACWIPGDLLDLGEFPGVVPSDGQVLGELYEVLDASAFDELDAFEGYIRGREDESEYVRRRVQLIEPDVEAWTYLYNRPAVGQKRVPSGDWRGHLAERLKLR
jgi:gamma-glutamylcyclotransferase (GGCT)/AIG2-like uncharacterized protein YtfP